MTKIDIISGFLGAGKTTLIKKLLGEAFKDEQVVLIENEFGEIGIDGGFLEEAGIEIKEMNSGCICCSLVGDFGTSLKEVLDKYTPDRIIIEPSGVGKLSDVMKAVNDAALGDGVVLNSAIAVVDASKAKMYVKNFGEFFVNQVEHAGAIILSRTSGMNDEKLQMVDALLKEHNAKATIVTTPWEDITGAQLLEAIEGGKSLADEMLAEVLAHREHEHEHHHHDHDHDHEHEHHHHDGECGCGHHHDEEEHEHHHHDHDHEHEHHHHDHDHEHHHHDGECSCGHHHDEEEHEHHHHDHDHEHHHDHGPDCTCGCHDHHHHHADEVFTSWGKETPQKYSKEEIETILSKLDSGDYGTILRAKGMVPSEQGGWIFFDYVPEERSVRDGVAQTTGKLCVIGAELKEDAIDALFSK
ncbi:MAG: GTP-binding protein [Lachnospiraceae bacterium]|nr:GTP-binding protein [Lachnospiraceae bacterium]